MKNVSLVYKFNYKFLYTLRSNLKGKQSLEKVLSRIKNRFGENIKPSITRQYLYKLEQGQIASPSLIIISVLADFYKVKLHDFILKEEIID